MVKQQGSPANKRSEPMTSTASDITPSEQASRASPPPAQQDGHNASLAAAARKAVGARTPAPGLDSRRPRKAKLPLPGKGRFVRVSHSGSSNGTAPSDDDEEDDDGLLVYEEDAPAPATAPAAAAATTRSSKVAFVPDEATCDAAKQEADVATCAIRTRKLLGAKRKFVDAIARAKANFYAAHVDAKAELDDAYTRIKSTYDATTAAVLGPRNEAAGEDCPVAQASDNLEYTAWFAKVHARALANVDNLHVLYLRNIHKGLHAHRSAAIQAAGARPSQLADLAHAVAAGSALALDSYAWDDAQRDPMELGSDADSSYDPEDDGNDPGDCLDESDHADLAIFDDDAWASAASAAAGNAREPSAAATQPANATDRLRRAADAELRTFLATKDLWCGKMFDSFMDEVRASNSGAVSKEVSRLRSIFGSFAHSPTARGLSEALFAVDENIKVAFCALGDATDEARKALQDAFMDAVVQFTRAMEEVDGKFVKTWAAAQADRSALGA